MSVEKVVLIGENIAHSRSPRLLNALFDHYELPYVYELAPTPAAHVVETIEAMKLGGYRGANVTSPHKLLVLPALDAVSDDAARIGAVNTILFEKGVATGYNTDVAGVCSTLDDDPLLDAPFTASIIGAGGAALAAVEALRSYANCRSIVVHSRLIDRASEAAARWNDRRIVGAALDEFSPGDLVVHATPVGLPGTDERSLDGLRLGDEGLFFEMIYSTAGTRLSARARSEGMRVVDGRRMFVAQALEAFRIWTGISPDTELVPSDLFEDEPST